jgi:hypothetical protein
VGRRVDAAGLGQLTPDTTVKGRSRVQRGNHRPTGPRLRVDSQQCGRDRPIATRKSPTADRGRALIGVVAARVLYALVCVYFIGLA